MHGQSEVQKLPNRVKVEHFIRVGKIKESFITGGQISERFFNFVPSKNKSCVPNRIQAVRR